MPGLLVPPGERVALVGPSGAGKTTLLHLLAGILPPGEGSVYLDDLDLAALASEDRQDVRILRMGLIFQEFELLDYLDVVENILLPYRVSPVLELTGAARERARALAREIGLTHRLGSYPRQLSQGERQRVAVCRALVTEPALLFGDEPTGNLDRKNRDLVMDMLFRYSDRRGVSLLVVTHDPGLQRRFDRVIQIEDYLHD